MKNDYVIRAAKEFAHRIVSETNDFVGTYLFSYCCMGRCFRCLCLEPEMLESIKQELMIDRNEYKAKRTN